MQENIPKKVNLNRTVVLNQCNFVSFLSPPPLASRTYDSRDMFVTTGVGITTVIYQVKATVAATHPTMHRTTLPSKPITHQKIPTVPRLRKYEVECTLGCNRFFLVDFVLFCLLVASAIESSHPRHHCLDPTIICISVVCVLGRNKSVEMA